MRRGERRKNAVRKSGCQGWASGLFHALSIAQENGKCNKKYKKSYKSVNIPAPAVPQRARARKKPVQRKASAPVFLYLRRYPSVRPKSERIALGEALRRRAGRTVQEQRFAAVRKRRFSKAAQTVGQENVRQRRAE